MSATARRRPTPGRRALVIGAALVAALVGPATPSAWAFIQYQVASADGQPTGVLIHWNRSCIPITAYPNGLPEMTTADIENAVASAAATWSKSELPCTYLDIQMSASFDPPRAAATDAYNVLIFRDPWCDPASSAPCQTEALAVTSVWAGRTSGVIHDADIEVNNDNFVWGDLVQHPASGMQDLQNAITHEMGHLIGLDHDCYTPTVDKFRQTDNNGNLAPFCLGADATVQEATMFTKADFGDLSKRTLAPDDTLGVCTIYPVASDPNYCPPPATATSTAGCGCRVERSSGSAGSLLIAALMLIGAARRSRCSRRRRGPHRV